jgi:hypothetical protein
MEGEKVIYNITLQSEEDDEAKVIDRFLLRNPEKTHKKLIFLFISNFHKFQIFFFLISVKFQHGRNVEET